VKRDPERILADCLEAIEKGRLSIDQCRHLFPQQWGELQQLLLLADNLRKAPRVSPSLSFRRQARQRLMLRISSQPSTQRALSTRQPKRKSSPLFRLDALRPSQQWLLIFLVVLSIATGVSVASASNDVLPGDVLYPIEAGIENLQLLLTRDPSEKAKIQVELAQERVGEMKQLAEKGRFEDIPQAVMDYQSQLDNANNSLRELVTIGDPRAQELGALLEEAWLYDSVMLTGLNQLVPEEIRFYVDAAISATRAGKIIAGQWIELLNDPSKQLSATSGSPEDGYAILPTDIACWPIELQIGPPQGVPLCEDGQTPIPLSEDLSLFCWPVDIPFDPPEGVPLCKQGELPIPIPEDLELICWPVQLPYPPPEGLEICQEGQLPVSIPSDINLRCWPSRIPYDAPPGIPICEDGTSPELIPTQLACWPENTGSERPAGVPTCSPDQDYVPPATLTPIPSIRPRDLRNQLIGLITQFASISCWPAELGRPINTNLPTCQTDELPLPIINGVKCWPSQILADPPSGIPRCAGN
jgi:hypothetical protein